MLIGRLLPKLVENSDLAHHWQRSVRFLQIVAEAWPSYLEEIGAMDPYARRLAVAGALADHWDAHPPASLVMIAGSTGATPASRELMSAALKLPKGLVVLPGLDRDISDAAAIEIRRDASHPQHALMLTLQHLGAAAGDVPIWPGAEPSANAHARTELVHEALAPATQTSDWLKRLGEISGKEDPATFARRALTGLSLIEANDEAEEAMCAALLLRETLETPGETAALVTPDAALARRVSALMKRWNVNVPPSAGRPLLRTPAGSFIALVLDWALDPGEPVKLCAVAKHPKLTQPNVSAEMLELHYLRGPRRWRSLHTLSDIARADQADPANEKRRVSLNMAETFARDMAKLIDAHAPDLGGDNALHGPQAAEQVAALAEALLETGEAGSGTRALWSGADGEAAARLLEAMAEASRPLGALPTHAMPGLLETLASGISVASDEPSHPRLNIWGPLEARLQTADRIILAGLSEGVWPKFTGRRQFPAAPFPNAPEASGYRSAAWPLSARFRTARLRAKCCPAHSQTPRRCPGGELALGLALADTGRRRAGRCSGGGACAKSRSS